MPSVALAIASVALVVSCGHASGPSFGVVTDGGKAGADGSAADGPVLPGDGGLVSDASAAFDAGLCCTWVPTFGSVQCDPVVTQCGDGGGGVVDDAICYAAHGTCEGPTSIVGSLAPCAVCTDGGGGCGGDPSTAQTQTSNDNCRAQASANDRTVVCIYPPFCPPSYVCAGGTDGGPTCL